MAESFCLAFDTNYMFEALLRLLAALLTSIRCVISCFEQVSSKILAGSEIEQEICKQVIYDHAKIDFKFLALE